MSFKQENCNYFLVFPIIRERYVMMCGIYFLSFPCLRLPPCCKYSFSLQSYGIGKSGKHRCDYTQKNRRQPSSNQDLGIPSIFPCIACLVFPVYAVLFCSKIKYLQEVFRLHKREKIKIDNLLK